jgi:predicted ATPase
MIESLSVTNFRGIERLELHGLKRINVIVGENASGKTAFLESIFLAGGASPEIALRLQAQRGIVQVLQIALDRTSYESLWRQLFWGFDQKKAISVALLGSEANTRSVTVAYRPEDSPTLPFGKADLESPFIVPITFEWKDARGTMSRAQPKITEQGLNLAGTGETMPIYLFASGSTLGAAENASRFSLLDADGKSDTFVSAMKEAFPFLEGISIQVVSGQPMLHATLSSSEIKVPLGLLSGGINKLASILLALAGRMQSVILIDEIENGFYYQLLPRIWSTLLSFCKQQGSQIFASTHSEECLRALLRTIGDNTEEFSLIRTERSNSRSTARVFGGRQLHSAIEQNIEIR